MRIFMEKRWGIVLFCLCVISGCLGHTFFSGKAEKAMFPMMDAAIVLDVGHGGWDPGKTGNAGKNEKELNLEVAEKLAVYLEMGGAEVILTRNSDAALGEGKRTDMAERKRIAKESNGDILVSIHQNAFPSEKVKGAQVFYYGRSENGKLLAEAVQENLKNRVDGSNDRQAKENNSYYILKMTEIPAVIVECGFLSNREEEKLLNDAGYQEKLAWAIYCGILDYFEKLRMI